MVHSYQHEVQSIEGTAVRNLTPQQKESMQILIKALSDFLVEDRHDAESITSTTMDYEEEDMSGKRPRKRASTQHSQESNTQRLNTIIAPSCSDDQVGQGVIRACSGLITESERFEYSLRTLGAGGPGMYGTWLLRKHLRSFLGVFQKFNIDELREGPRKSGLSEREAPLIQPLSDLISPCIAIIGHTLDCYIEKLPEALSELRNAFQELDSSLMGFVAFFYSTDLRRVLKSIIDLLRDECESLKRLEGREYIPPDEGESIRTKILVFFSEMERYFQTCSAELSDYRKQGVPLIQTAQYNQSDRYLMLTTISTFFSAVTSATLQMAQEQDPGSDNATLGAAVNLFFYLSLIFSTASAVQALLAMSWIRSFIRVPYEKLAFHWVSKGPLLSLVMSGAFFAIGLCLFVIASEKTSLTTFFVIVFAFLHTTGLIIGRKLTDTSVMMSLLACVHALFWKKSERDGKDRSSEKHRPQMVGTASPDVSVIEIRVEPPTRVGSLVSFIDPTDIRSIHSQELLDEEQFTSRRAPQNSDKTLVGGSETRILENRSTTLVGGAPASITSQVSESVILQNRAGEVFGVVNPYWGSSEAKDEEAARSSQWWMASGSATDATGTGILGTELVGEPLPLDSVVPDTYEGVNDTQGIFGKGIVKEPLVFNFDNAEADIENEGAKLSSNTEDPFPEPADYQALPLESSSLQPDSSTLASSSYALSYHALHQAVPLPQSAYLQARQDTWEERLRQESISLMEMYNRRNPRKKRTYPPFETPPP